MQLTEITDQDAKYLLQIKNILKLTVTELKFSLGDAKIVDESIRWFDAFMDAASNTQKMEAKKNLKTDQKKKAKTEGLSSLKIKDFTPGSLPIRKSGTKAKKSKGKK